MKNNKFYMPLKKREAFTLTEVLIVMSIMVTIVFIIMFLIMFVFQTTYKIHFNLSVISVYETINSQLDNIISLWYVDENRPVTNPNGNLRKLELPSRKLTKNGYGWLEVENAPILIAFDETEKSIKYKAGDNSTKTVFSHGYLKDLNFSIEEKGIVAIYVFEDLRETITSTKTAMFKTIN